MGFSLPHLIVVLAVALLLFGTKRLRNLGGDLGEAIKGFKKAMNDEVKPEILEKKSEDPQTPENQHTKDQTS